MNAAQLFQQAVNVAANSPHPIEQALAIGLAFLVPAGMATLLLSGIKQHFVREIEGTDRIFISIRKRAFNYDWSAFAQVLLSMLSLAMAWAGDYLVNHPYDGKALVGVAGAIFMLATLLHRIKLSKLYPGIVDFLSYLSRYKKPVSDGVPSA